MSSSVIFIGSAEHFGKKASSKFLNKSLFLITPKDLVFRIFASFVPPIMQKYQKIYVDLLGPILGLLFLTCLLIYGYSFKQYKVSNSPTNAVVTFSLMMPLISYLLAKIGKSSINFLETISLVGYNLYGHIFTLLVSFLCYQDQSNFFFFLCLIVFDGLSTFRLILVFLKTIPVPAARFLICSVISVLNILFTLYLHFAFMHSTFGYESIQV